MQNINFNYIDQVAELSRETAIELIDYFLLSKDGWLDELKESTANIQSGELKDRLHKLKGAVRVLGFVFINSFIEEWEAKLKANNFDQIPEQMKQLELYFELACNAIAQKRSDYLR